MSPADVERLSAMIERRLLALPEYVSAKRLALYSSFENEVSTTDIFHASLSAGKEVFFPKSDAKRRELSFFRVDSHAELAPGLYEIKEPRGEGHNYKGEVASFDLVVVPGICFDLAGARIGYGKGFYDRVLEGAGSLIVALAYDFQLIGESIPTEAHDVPVDIVVTESRVVRF